MALSLLPLSVLAALVRQDLRLFLCAALRCWVNGSDDEHVIWLPLVYFSVINIRFQH
jgi:hypothetical protein